MLQKGFFLTEPFTPEPFWDNTIVNLSGAQKFDADTHFPPGRYSVIVAPGVDSSAIKYVGDGWTSTMVPQVILKYTENIPVWFKIRAYCGSNAVNDITPGTNPYNGEFKINAVTAADLINTQLVGQNSTSVFGAGGGNSLFVSSNPVAYSYYGGTGNCLGDGAVCYYSGSSRTSSGAGSCLHFLPIHGEFGTDYIRAYHVCAASGGACGSAYGGASSGYVASTPGSWTTNGGSSPYGSGGTIGSPDGTGAGNSAWTPNGCKGAAAYFNGTQWVDVGYAVDTTTADTRKATSQLYKGVLNTNSCIIVTYLGPLN